MKTITSLRGISILGVLFYHAKFEWFQQGYLGVDVFFVISGFLIGNIIFSEIKNYQFKFSIFYTRRLRRLMPSLVVTIVSSYIIFYYVFLPEDFELLKNSIPYTLLFFGNIFFWNTSDYFSPSTDIMPLSHLWSLAIEEQFYFIFPLVIFFIFKNKVISRHIKLLLFLGIVLSFFYTISGYYNLPFDCPTSNCIEVTNFYWLHTRVWEILVGVLLNFVNLNSSFFNKNFIYLGSLLILLSFNFSLNSLSHPGVGTLLTIFGTIIVIISSLKNDDNLLSRSSLLYFLGKISYSLYLIHFPIFVIKNYFDFKVNLFQNFDIAATLLIFLSVFIAFFMWKYIETPFRDLELISNKNFFKIFIFSILSIFIVVYSQIIPDKSINAEFENFNFSTDFNIKRECFFEKIPENLSIIDSCMTPIEDKQNVIIIGSSVAQNIYYGLSNSSQDINFGLVSVPGCPPLLEPYQYELLNLSENNCGIIYERVLKNLKEKEYSTIILNYQWHELINKQISDDSSLFDYTVQNLLLNISKDKLFIVGQPVRWNSSLKAYALRELNFMNTVNMFSSSNLSNNIFITEEIFKLKMFEFQINSYSLIENYCHENKCLVYEKLGDVYYFTSGDFIHISNYFSLKIAKTIINNLHKFNQ